MAKETKQTLSIYLSKDLRERADEVADNDERSLSSLVRKALKSYLAKLEKTDRIKNEEENIKK